jgi:CheY-like chemotaxis protein
MAHLVVLTGPPLPGRWSLARTLQERWGARRWTADAEAAPVAELTRALAGASSVLVDGDLPTAAARRQLLACGRGSERLLVEWCCPRAAAEREIFHRYASRPRCLAEAELRRYEEDARRRQPVGDELSTAQIVRVHAGRPIDAELAAVWARLPPDPAVASASRARQRVLVVEDDHDERAMLAEVLAELGLEVELAPDAGVALALLDEGVAIDLLISDHCMPGMSGAELAQAVRGRHPRVRTVLLTAFSDNETCHQALRANAVSVLSKPLRVVDLERVLDEARVQP